MSDKIVHLYEGVATSPTVSEVTSFITRCCQRVLPDGLGTVDPETCTCPDFKPGGSQS